MSLKLFVVQIFILVEERRQSQQYSDEDFLQTQQRISFFNKNQRNGVTYSLIVSPFYK
jgi:hypothetical protein